jgi:hypothetical protein
MHKALGVVVAIVVLALAACSDGGDRLVAGSGGTAGDGTGAEPEGGGGTPVGTPGGAPGGLVVSIEVGGGFVPVGFDFRALPTAVVYEDGTTLSGGAFPMVFPGPAVHPVVRAALAAEEVRGLVGSAAEAGLLEPGEVDFGDPGITDVPTTTVTVVVDGEAHATSVYGLADVDVDVDAEDPLPGLTDAQVEARRRVAGFVAEVTEAVTAAEAEPYVPDRYRVLPIPSSGEPADGGAPEEREWPVPEVTPTEGQCRAVTGAGAVALGQALADADELTRWRTPAGTFSLAVRPVLPHEPDCPV